MNHEIQQADLFELLKGLKDPRRKQGQRHSLQTVVIIVIMAVMSGAKGQRAITRFAENNREELITTLGIKRREIPSRSVINGIMQNIDFGELEKIFSAWAMRLTPIEQNEWLNIDGKAIGGTVKDAQGHRQNFVSLVSVFAGKRKQVLAAGKIHTKKESEIPKVKELVEMLDLEGVVFTLDALHCQKETTKTIVGTNNDYCIGVKGNQPKLHEQVKKTADRRSR